MNALMTILRLLLALLALAGGMACAQTEDEAGGVTPSRLSIAEGPVSFWRAGMTEWAAAQLNTALANGDSIHTGERGAAELQVGPQDYVRLTGDSTLTVVAQAAGLLQFRVLAGTVSFDLRSVQAGQMIEIDTPHGAVVVGRAGYYRVDVRGNATHVTVRNGGQAMLVREGSRNNTVSANEEMVLTGGEGGGTLSIERRAAAAPDAWDRWNDARSDYYASSTSLQYVPAGVYGVADLDRHGAWREVPTYGHVWVPAVATGWAPYSTGSWQWDPVFGWTWVDDAPWGWATSHYGRWVVIDGFWAWAPGPRVVRPAYAPALVAFFHGGSGVSWVALGWGEPLIPWWGRPGFRGTAWWGGWGGPRVVNQRPHHSGAVDVSRIRFSHAGRPDAVITVKYDAFHRERIHGSRLPPPQARDLAPVRGEHPVRPRTTGGGVAAPVRPAPQALPRPEMPQVSRPEMPQVPRAEMQPFPRPELPQIPRPEMQPFPRPEMPQIPRPEMRPFPRPVPQPGVQPMPRPIEQPAIQPAPQQVPPPAIAQPPAAQQAPTPQAVPQPRPEFPHPQRQRPLDPGERPFGRREALDRPAPNPGPDASPVPTPGFPRRDESRGFRDRDSDRRFDNRQRMDIPGDPQRFDQPPRGSGEPPGRMFRHRDQ